MSTAFDRLIIKEATPGHRRQTFTGRPGFKQPIKLIKFPSFCLRQTKQANHGKNNRHTRKTQARLRAQIHILAVNQVQDRYRPPIMNIELDSAATDVVLARRRNNEISPTISHPTVPREA
jgi:hypothetical protein